MVSNDSEKEKHIREEKRKRDRFSVTIIGVVIYSIVLIAVMVASYVGVKAIFRNHDQKVAALLEQQTEEISQEPESTPTPTPEPEEETDEDITIDHGMSPDELIDPETGIAMSMMKTGTHCPISSKLTSLRPWSIRIPT